MPKIRINEFDNTSPGASNGYANFAVLIPGFIGRDPITLEDEKKDLTGTTKADEIQPDSNGVYEFTSAEKFEKIIGLAGPSVLDGGVEIARHYGNQMAYELLNLGYPIIYKPLTEPKSIADLGKASFWEIFKDKASYDFRFITHGLLESSDNKEYNEFSKRLIEVETAIAKLKAIESSYVPSKTLTGSELQAEQTAYYNKQFQEVRAKFPGFIGITETEDELGKVIESSAPYESYADAVKGTEAEKAALITSLEDADEEGVVTGYLINKANTAIADLAKYYDKVDDASRTIPGRGDCVALIELDERSYLSTDSTETSAEAAIINSTHELSNIDQANGKYCALTVPSVYYTRADTKLYDNNKKFPGAFHYLACFMNSQKLGFAEWYAAAGYTRGVSSYTVDYTSVKLGEIAINALEPRYYEDPAEKYPKFACNVIANFRGSYYLWGNRTAHPLGKKGDATNGDLVASSFLNIRHLCTTIKKQLYVTCRKFTFDPNSDTLWVNFVNAIKPTLEQMKADQGIRDYKVIKEDTPTKATLKAKIRIIPIEAVEDFDLEVYLEDSFGDVAVSIPE